MLFNLKWLTEVTQHLEYYLVIVSKLAGVFQFPLHLKHLNIVKIHHLNAYQTLKQSQKNL
jgi:hypothetical protein